MSEPTAGALRVAKIISFVEEGTYTSEDDVVAAAHIIDRETGLPELLEALEKIATYEPASFTGAETDITAEDYAYAFGYVQQAAKSALAKIQRES